jgi:hypothetical protein
MGGKSSMVHLSPPTRNSAGFSGWQMFIKRFRLFFIDIFKGYLNVFMSDIFKDFKFNANKSWGISGGGASTSSGI